MRPAPAALTACGERCGHDPFETFSAAHRVDTAPLLGYGSPRLNYYDPRNTEAGDYAALLNASMLRTKSASATGEGAPALRVVAAQHRESVEKINLPDHDETV